MQKTIFRFWPYPLALACGLLNGYLDLHSSEVQGSVLVILTLTFFFGFGLPRHAWRWALLIGLGIPLVHWGGLLFGYHVYATALPWHLDTLLALIPAFIGTYVGVGVRNILRSAPHMRA